MLEVEQRGLISIFHMTHGKANTLDVEFCEALTARLEADRYTATQALVLIGQGHIFSAGVDLLRVMKGGPGYLTTFLPALRRLFATLFCFPKPVVAAINGHAIAGGCVLACAADTRLMAQEVGRIGVPELRVGVPFPTIALEIVRTVLAPPAFPAVLYEGATFAPADALTRGLVDTLVASDTLLAHAVAADETLAALPPPVFALTKQQVRAPVMQHVRDAGPADDEAVDALWAAPATLAAIRAYVARTLKH